MILTLADIYPTKVAQGSLIDTFTREEFISIQDAVENTSFETHERLHKPQSLPAVTDNRLFLHRHAALTRMKFEFETGCIAIHEEKYPYLKGKFSIYESICKGVILNSKTTVQDTMSNYPWHYTGIAIIRAPENLPTGQGDIVFVDPLPVSEKGDQSGITAKLGNMAIFPAWLKYRFRPIAWQENEYDTVMMLIMNAFVVHERLEDFEIKEKNNYNLTGESDVLHLGPSKVTEEIELNTIDHTQISKEINIGKF